MNLFHVHPTNKTAIFFGERSPTRVFRGGVRVFGQAGKRMDLELLGRASHIKVKSQQNVDLFCIYENETQTKTHTYI